MGDEQVIHLQIVAARASHSEGVPVVEDPRVGLRKEGEQRGLIVDYLVRRDDTGVLNSLISSVLDDFRREGVVSVSCSVSATQQEHIRQFRAHAFITQTPGANIVAASSPMADTLQSVENWFFTYADGDIDYCDWEDNE